MKFELPPLLISLRRRLVLANSDTEGENAQIDGEGDHQKADRVLLEQAFEPEAIVLLEAIYLACEHTRFGPRRPSYS